MCTSISTLYIKKCAFYCKRNLVLKPSKTALKCGGMCSNDIAEIEWNIIKIHTATKTLTSAVLLWNLLYIRRTCEILNTHFSPWNIGNQFCFAKLWYTTTTFMPSRYLYTTKYNNKNLVLKNETDILFCLHSKATTKTGHRHLIHAFERVSLGT